MSEQTPLVLLVGRGFMSSSHLREKLQYWDCEFHVAATYAEAHSLLNRHRFDLVLSETSLPDGRASRLIPWLVGSPTTLFLSFPTDGTCWWLPAVDHGQQCWGAHALRPREFARVLDRILYALVSAGDAQPRAVHQSPPRGVNPHETGSSERLSEEAAVISEVRKRRPVREITIDTSSLVVQEVGHVVSSSLSYRPSSLERANACRHSSRGEERSRTP